jgi:carbonic anhydrase
MLGSDKFMDIIYRVDPHAPLTTPRINSAEEALAKLAAGNARFHSLVCRVQDAACNHGHHPEVVIPVSPISLGVPFISGVAPSHNPYALILGCSDARVPLESVLDCAANEVFVVRVAGNVLGVECLGSIDYAVCNLKSSLRTVIVMGHTGCGAVSAAVDIYLTPSDFPGIAFSHALRSLVDRIMLTVRGADRALKRIIGDDVSSHPNYRQLLIDTAIYMNAAVTAHDLQREVRSICEDMNVVYSVYDVAHAQITALPYAPDESKPLAFAPAPLNAEDFHAVANEVVLRLQS